MTRQRLVFAGVVVVMIAVLALAGRGREADATLAFRRFLAASGISVRSSARPPVGPATYLLLADGRSLDQERPILNWVDRGGRLVVADPTSLILEMVGVEAGPPVGLVGSTAMTPGCATPATAGVRDVVVYAADATLRASTPDVVECFARTGGAYAAVVRRGAGSVVALGGSSFLTNDLLDRGDNAVFALRLAAGGPVVLGPAFAPGTTPPTVWQLMPIPARVVVVGILLAAATFATARSRRLGTPVDESIPAPIPASELVAATAALYRRARSVGYCGTTLRESARYRLARGVGALPDTPADRLSDEVARRTSLPLARVREAIAGPDPTTDDELIALATELNEIVRTMEGAPR